MGLKKAAFKTPPTDSIKKVAPKKKKKKTKADAAPKKSREPGRREMAYNFKGSFRVGAGKVVAADKKRKKVTVSFDPSFLHALRGRLNELEFERGLQISISDLLMVATAHFFDELPTDDQIRLIEEGG